MAISSEELLQTFVEEATEHLSTIENDFLAIERAGDNIDMVLINKVFRAAHSIKGGAGLIGLNHLKDLAHKMETLLGQIRSRKITPHPAIINSLLIASDTLKNLVKNIDTSDEIDISPALEALDSINEGQAPIKELIVEPETPTPQISLEDIFSEMMIPEEDLVRVLNSGKKIYMLRIDLENDPGFTEKSKEDILDDIKDYGQVLSFKTGTNPYLFIAFACVLDLEDVIALLDMGKENIWLLGGNPISPSISSKACCIKEESVQSSHDLSESTHSKDSCKIQQVKTGKEFFRETSPATIRVNTRALDSLMNLAGELVLARNQLINTISSNDLRNTEIISKRIDIITSDLQKTILLTRMQPVGNLFNKYPRVARNLASELGKEVDLILEGKDVELDRTILEAMSDPLNHLILNAVDHGIETSDVRKKTGKRETGTIILKAFNEAGQVVIDVIDDGSGIEPERISEAAIAKKFVTEDQVKIMTRKDRLNLIFLPGLTTARKVSDISGRGVGMDVVKTNLEKLGGLIDIDSEPGNGTRIRIKLPLTLAIISSQVVLVEDQRFAIPNMNIEELIRIPAFKAKERIELVGNATVLRFREKLLPLVRLSDILRIERTFFDPGTQQKAIDRRINIADRRSRRTPLIEDDVKPENSEKEKVEENRKNSDRRYRAASALHIAVVSTGRIKYGLIVDAFHDSKEIVIKPLGIHLKDCSGYAGATIMGDGKVALILDINSLSKMAGLFPVSGLSCPAVIARTAEKEIKPGSDQLDILIFRNASDEQFAIFLNQVLRIEKISHKDVKLLGKHKTIQYGGENLIVFSIDETAKVQPFSQNEDILVIILMVSCKKIGLLANKPANSLTTHAIIDGVTLKQPGIMGSVIVDGKTTLIVDVFNLVRRLLPEWFSVVSDKRLAVTRKQTVLVADDSNFFRTQIKSFIQDEGYLVADAENGEAAWEILQKSGEGISLVVTDMEMPELDGFGLTARIRKDRRFSKLPVIALTTLADDKDMERATTAGVSDYQIKLDKERLLYSINAFIHEKGST